MTTAAANDAKPDPFEMGHSDLALEVSQLRHYEEEAKELMRWLSETIGLDQNTVNKLLAERLAKQGGQ